MEQFKGKDSFYVKLSKNLDLSKFLFQQCLYLNVIAVASKTFRVGDKYPLVYRIKWKQQIHP